MIRTFPSFGKEWLPALLALILTGCAAAHVAENVIDDSSIRPINKAASKGDIDTLRKLLDQNPKLADVANSGGYTPLHLAALNGRDNCVQLLLERGANMEAKDKSGDTPLSDAARFHRQDAAALLLAHGADPNATNKEGRTPLHRAAMERSVEMVRLLLEHDADVNARESNGETPLHLAAAFGRLANVRELLGHGADLNAKDDYNQSPVMVTAFLATDPVQQFMHDRYFRNDVSTQTVAEVTDYLLSQGAELDIFAASALGRAQTVHDLLAADPASANVKDKYEATPLHYAATFGHMNVVQELLAAGAVVNPRDRFRKTPLMMADRFGHKDVADTLRKHGASD